MSTLLAALSDGSYDMQNKRDLSTNFSRKLLSYRDSIVSDYLKYKTNLSESISKIAKRDSLNDDQIQRIIEEVNNQIYLIEYDKNKMSANREVEFDIASMQGVKKYLNGTSDTDNKESENKEEENKQQRINKSAFETVKLDGLEKVASDNSSPFGEISRHKYCDMSAGTKISKDEFMLKKIAETVVSKKAELEKLANKADFKCYELADMVVSIERLGANTQDITSSMIKSANLTEKEYLLIKEAAEARAKHLIETRYLPDNFEINLGDISLDKTASEKFSLGAYSKLNNGLICDSPIPKMELSTGKSIQSFSDICKLASEFKQSLDSLVKENDVYVSMREKCAGYGITNEMIEDYDFFQLSQVRK